MNALRLPLFLLGLCWLLVLPVAAIAQNFGGLPGQGSFGVGVEIVEHGIFAPALSEALPPAVQGRPQLLPAEAVRLLQRSTRIPAEEGLLFGILFQVRAPEGAAQVRLELELDTPDATGPAALQELLVQPEQVQALLLRVPPVSVGGEYRLGLGFQGEELAVRTFYLAPAASGLARR